MKTVSQFDDAGYFIGATVADESPLEPGIFLLPAGAKDIEPPIVPAGQRARLVGDDLIFEDIPVPEQESNPPLSVDQVWQLIKAMRDGVKAGGVLVNGNWYHTDADSRIQHLGLKDEARDLLAAGGALTDRIQIDGEDVRWKTMSGVFVYITAQLAFDIVAADKVLDMKAFTAAEVHRAALLAAADPSAYDYSGDWPVTFESLSGG